MWNLYNNASTPWKWHKKLFHEARKNKLEIFSSPFDESAVDFLETLNVPAYKIASFENNHLPLIEKVAMTKKPVIISTGMAKIKEIKEVVKIFKKCGNKNYHLFKQHILLMLLTILFVFSMGLIIYSLS